MVSVEAEVGRLGQSTRVGCTSRVVLAFTATDPATIGTILRVVCVASERKIRRARAVRPPACATAPSFPHARTEGAGNGGEGGVAGGDAQAPAKAGANRSDG